MARALRSNTKVAPPIDISDAANVRTRISKPATRGNRRSARQRSQPGSQENGPRVAPTEKPRRGRKRRDGLESQATTPKRQRTEQTIEVAEQSQPHDSGDSETDGAPQGLDFYRSINVTLSRKAVNPQDVPQDQGDEPEAQETRGGQSGDSVRQSGSVSDDEGDDENEEGFKGQEDNANPEDGADVEEQLGSNNKDQLVQETDAQSHTPSVAPGLELHGSEERPPASDEQENHPSIRRGTRRRRSQRAKSTFDHAQYKPPGRQASPELGSDARDLWTVSPRNVQASDYQAVLSQPQAREIEEFFSEVDEDEDRVLETQAGDVPRGTAGEMDDDPKAYDPNQTLGLPDDSVFIECAEKPGGYIMTEISSKYMKDAVTKMATRGWTGNLSWQEIFCRAENEEKETWLGKHTRAIKSKRCKSLFANLNTLRELLYDMPKAPDIDEQFTFLKESETMLKKLFRNLRAWVDGISKTIAAGIGSPDVPERHAQVSQGAKNAVESLHGKIIPMLILVMKEAFMVGGFNLSAATGSKVLPDKADFTSSTLDILFRIMGWTQRLYEVMQDYLICNPEQPKNKTKQALQQARGNENRRNDMGRCLEHLNNDFRKARDALDYIATAPEREREARERDKTLAVQRERKEREEREARERQFQLFVESTQRMAQATSPPVQSQRPAAQREEYFLKHGGWHYWEDDRLLNIIRKVLRPDMALLAKRVPNRTVAEVEQRVRELKDRMRAKYEDTNMVPPQWCYHYS